MLFKIGASSAEVLYENMSMAFNGGDFILGIVDGIAKRCRCQLTDTYETVYKLLQFRGSFRAKYEGDCIGEFLNLSLHDFLLRGILFDRRIEFYVGHF